MPTTDIDVSVSFDLVTDMLYSIRILIHIKRCTQVLRMLISSEEKCYIHRYIQQRLYLNRPVW